MNAGHFRFKNVSTGDLNRGRRTESRVLFDSFCTTQKECKNVPFAGSSEVPQTSNQRTKITTSCNPIKSFCRSAASSGGYAAFFCCLRQPVAALGGFSFRLAAVSLPGRHTPCAFLYFLHAAKSKKSTFPSGGGERAHKERGIGYFKSVLLLTTLSLMRNSTSASVKSTYFLSRSLAM